MVIKKNYDQYNLFHIAETKKAETNQKNPVVKADFFPGEVQVSISKEGLKQYRSSMVEEQKKRIEDEEKFEATIREDKILLKSHRYMISGETNHIMETKKREREGASLTSEDRAQSMLEAYANLYDEIVRGYEDGTREIYVDDAESPNGYRLLTKEEELERLDDAYKELSEGYEMQLERDREANEIILKQYRKIAASIAVQRGRNDKVMEYLEKAKMLEEQMKAEWNPKDLARNLLRGSRLFKSQYEDTGDKNIIKDISSMIFEEIEAL